MLTASAVYYTMPTVQEAPSNALAIACMQYGSNGDVWGPPEYSVANSSGSESDGSKQWDSAESGPFDSDWVDFTLVAQPGQGVTLTVDDGTGPVNVSAAFSSISSIEVDAGVQTNASMTFQDLDVSFFDSSGNETSCYSTSGGPSIDETNSSDPVGEQIVQVTPASGTSASEVVVTGQIRLQAPDGVFPGASDIFGDIAIFGG